MPYRNALNLSPRATPACSNSSDDLLFAPIARAYPQQAPFFVYPVVLSSFGHLCGQHLTPIGPSATILVPVFCTHNVTDGLRVLPYDCASSSGCGCRTYFDWCGPSRAQPPHRRHRRARRAHCGPEPASSSSHSSTLTQTSRIEEWKRYMYTDIDPDRCTFQVSAYCFMTGYMCVPL